MCLLLHEAFYSSKSVQKEETNYDPVDSSARRNEFRHVIIEIGRYRKSYAYQRDDHCATILNKINESL